VLDAGVVIGFSRLDLGCRARNVYRQMRSMVDFGGRCYVFG